MSWPRFKMLYQNHKQMEGRTLLTHLPNTHKLSRRRNHPLPVLARDSASSRRKRAEQILLPLHLSEFNQNSLRIKNPVRSLQSDQGSQGDRRKGKCKERTQRTSTTMTALTTAPSKISLRQTPPTSRRSKSQEKEGG